MMNYVDAEEFEMRDGVYVSANRIMGENFYIDRKSPFGKFFEELFFREGIDGLREYVGAGKNDCMIVDGKKVYTEAVGDGDPGVPGAVKLGRLWYRFEENSTLVIESKYWGKMHYVEVHDDFEFRIKDLYRTDVGGQIMEYIMRSNVRGFVREFIEWDGKLLMVFNDVWGDFLKGYTELRSDAKSFSCEAKLNAVEGKIILREVPFVEGVYTLSIPLYGRAVDVAGLSVKSVPKHVRKTLRYGPGAIRGLYPKIKRIMVDENGNVVLDRGEFRIYMDEDGFGVEVLSTPRWFRYDDWEVVLALLKAGGEAIEFV